MAISRDQLLDAAEAVGFESGVSALTLDAVAQRAGISKGGLIHHFPSKERLIEAMVARIVDGHRQAVLAAIEAQPPGPGRVPKAILNLCFNCSKEWNDSMRRTCMVLIAALVANPALAGPIRELNREVDRMLDADGLEPGYGQAVIAAMDGMWFWWLLGVAEPDPVRRDQVHAALEQLIRLGAKESVRK